MAAKTAAGKTPDTKEMRAKAVASLSKHIEAYETAGTSGAGHWVGIPDDVQDWHFVRFNRSSPHHREVASLLLSQGYLEAKDVAPSARMIGFESDGDNKMYLCCPPEVRVWHQNEKERKRRERFSLMEKDFGKHLHGIPGKIEVDIR